MKALFSTVVRSAPVEQGGEVVLADLSAKAIEAAAPIVPTDPSVDDPNPRGNSRGGRGIAVLNGEVIVAGYHSLHCFRPDLTPTRKITHPLMVGVHEIQLTPQRTLWVSATAVDAALEFDISSGTIARQIWPREQGVFQRMFDLSPLEIDKSVDNRLNFLSRSHLEHPSHLHLNAVALYDGEVHALFNNFGAIANLDRSEVAAIDPAIRGAHNLVIGENSAFVNNTLNRAVHIFDVPEWSLRKTLELGRYRWAQRLLRAERRAAVTRRLRRKLKLSSASRPAAKPLFVRGLDVRDELLVVGVSPATLLVIDWKRETLLDTFHYVDDINVAVHGLKVVEWD